MKSHLEQIRTDTGCPFEGKAGRLEPSGVDSAKEPSTPQFDRVVFQALRSTALCDAGDRCELCAPKWSSYGSCCSSEVTSAGVPDRVETHTVIIFNIF